jgi:predicted enzyme related to lactoylglutathione lyase
VTADESQDRGWQEVLMGAPVAFFEVISTNPDRIRNFYSRLFGWTTTDSGQPGYWLADTGAGSQAIGGGIGGTQPGEEVGRTTIYMRVDDLQAYLDKAERLGGKTLVPPTPLPGDFGSFAMFTDPDGQPVGLWT